MGSLCVGSALVGGLLQIHKGEEVQHGWPCGWKDLGLIPWEWVIPCGLFLSDYTSPGQPAWHPGALAGRRLGSQVNTPTEGAVALAPPCPGHMPFLLSLSGFLRDMS